jgi:glutathione synthase
VRGNLAAGGKGVAQADLSERDREIANALGPVLASRGLLLVGLDVIGDVPDRSQRHQPNLLSGDF